MTKKIMLTRFMSKIVKTSTQCWEFRDVQHGWYSSFYLFGKITKAHRVAFQLFKGRISRGMWVLHKCDNKKCVNPAHLFLGTAKDNAIDREFKGRGADKRGEAHPLSKLRNTDVLSIIKMGKKGIKQHVIAHQFGISQSYASRLINGKGWEHINVNSTDASV